MTDRMLEAARAVRVLRSCLPSRTQLSMAATAPWSSCVQHLVNGHTDGVDPGTIDATIDVQADKRGWFVLPNGFDVLWFVDVAAADVRPGTVMHVTSGLASEPPMGEIHLDAAAAFVGLHPEPPALPPAARVLRLPVATLRAHVAFVPPLPPGRSVRMTVSYLGDRYHSGLWKRAHARGGRLCPEDAAVLKAIPLPVARPDVSRMPEEQALWRQGGQVGLLRPRATGAVCRL